MADLSPATNRMVHLRGGRFDGKEYFLPYGNSLTIIADSVGWDEVYRATGETTLTGLPIFECVPRQTGPLAVP